MEEEEQTASPFLAEEDAGACAATGPVSKAEMGPLDSVPGRPQLSSLLSVCLFQQLWDLGILQ